MKIALAQCDIIWEDKKANLSMAEAFISQASREAVDLVLFPEMSLTGFTMNVNSYGECYPSDSIMDNPTTFDTIEEIKTLAVKYSINIGVGYIEKLEDNSKGKNNYVIISSLGEVVSSYSKIHPFTFGKESTYYTGGDAISHAKINDFTVCTFICYDLRFPEIFQTASKDAQLITVAANWPEVRRNHWITLLQARAIENQCYIAGINRVGTGDGINYSGDSLIIDPLGNIISSALEGIEGLIIGELDLSLVNSSREKFPLKKDRRENLYSLLNKDIRESIH